LLLALLSATVGLILRIIEDRSKWVGRIVAGLLGMAWTVASFMVVPVIVPSEGAFWGAKGIDRITSQDMG